LFHPGRACSILFCRSPSLLGLIIQAPILFEIGDAGVAAPGKLLNSVVRQIGRIVAKHGTYSSAPNGVMLHATTTEFITGVRFP